MLTLFRVRAAARAIAIFTFALLFSLAALAQDGAPPSMHALAGTFWIWCLQHPLVAAGLAIFILSNAITALSKYPRASGIVAVLKIVCDLISCVPHRDSPGLFSLPLTRSKPPDDADHMSLVEAAGGVPKS